MRSTFNKGDVIFRQGDAADSMFDILSGSVGIYVGYGTEHETQVTVLNAGDFLGEMGLIECYPRSATAVAMEDGTALQEIGEKEFSEYFNSRPMRLLTIMQQLSQRLRDRTDDYEGACRVLEGLKRIQPDNRSKTLMEMARELLDRYESVMNTAYEVDDTMYIPYAYIYQEHI